MDRSHSLWTYAKIGDIKAVQGLFSHGLASPFDIDPEGCSALMNMAWRDNTDMIKFLLQQQADPHIPDQAGRTASHMLWTSAFTDRLGIEGPSMVASLLEDDDYIDMMGLSTLHRAVVCPERLNLESELWKKRSTDAINKVDTRGRTPLIWAVLRDDPMAVQKLLSFGAKGDILDKRGKNVIHYVRSPDILLSLLEAGTTINVTSRYCYNTPLHEIAIRHDCVDVINVLARKNIPIDPQNKDGQTPLIFAVTYRHTKIATQLINLGADVNATSKSTGCSVILAAVENNHFEILPMLLERGANYTAIDVEGRNIAHQAARFASKDMMAILARSASRMSRLDVTLIDRKGKSPGDYRRERSQLVGPEADSEKEWRKLLASLPPRCEGSWPPRAYKASSHADQGLPKLPGAWSTD